MFQTMQEIIQLSRQNGYTFFDEKRQSQEETTVHPSVYYGRYFITEDTFRNKRCFSIYRALKDGACDIVRGYVFPNKRQAERYIKMFLDYEEETTEEYFNG